MLARYLSFHEQRSLAIPLRMVFSSAFSLRTGSCGYGLTRDKSDVRDDSPADPRVKTVTLVVPESKTY